MLGVVSKQVSQLRGRVGDSTALVNSLSPKIRLLDEDDIAFCCGYIVGHLGFSSGMKSKNLSSSNLNFSILTLSMSLIYYVNELYSRGPNTVIAFS